MNLKIGHGCEERHRKESYVVLSPKSTYAHFALALQENNNDKKNMNKIANFSSLKKYFY